MTSNTFHSLQSFAVSHPPMLMFTVCLMIFGVTLVAFANIVGRTQLPNPDVSLDWNIFLDHVTKFNLCVYPQDDKDQNFQVAKPKEVILAENPKNSTSNSSDPSAEPAPKALDKYNSLGAMLPDISKFGARSGEEPVLYEQNNVVVAINFNPDICDLDYKHILRWSVSSKHLGDLSRDRKFLNVTLYMKQDQVSCHNPSETVTKLVCLSFYGPSNLMPKTKKPEVACHPPYHVDDWSYKPVIIKAFHEDVPDSRCKKGGVFVTMSHTANSNFTVMLSDAERQVISTHLINASYLFFVIVFTLVCYRLIRGHFLIKNTKMYAVSQDKGHNSLSNM